MKKRNQGVFFAINILTLLLFVFVQSNYAGEKPEKAYSGKKVTLRVDGLSCPFCAYGLEKKLKSLKSVKSIEIKINDGLVSLLLKKNGRVTRSEIEKKIKEAGFTLKEILPENGKTPQKNG